MKTQKNRNTINEEFVKNILFKDVTLSSFIKSTVILMYYEGKLECHLN